MLSEVDRQVPKTSAMFTPLRKFEPPTGFSYLATSLTNYHFMLITLLIETIQPATQGTPVTVYVTLFAAVLAGLASLNATRISSKTAREVAALSAQTAQESARLAAQTAQELKEKDYKNDFYKRIIEKRLKAWERAEELMGLLAPAYIDQGDNRNYFSYFSSTELFENVLDMIRSSIVTQAIWMDKKYMDDLRKLHNVLADIRKNSYKSPLIRRDNGRFELDSALIMEAGKLGFIDFRNSFKQLVSTLGRQVKSLHDVESFLNQLQNVSIYSEDSE